MIPGMVAAPPANNREKIAFTLGSIEAFQITLRQITVLKKEWDHVEPAIHALEEIEAFIKQQ